MESKRSYVILPVLLFLSLHAGAYSGVRKELDIGVVADMGSRTGKNVHTCISMAVSDFYASHDHYKTRLVLHTRDSEGDPVRAMSSVVHMLKDIKIQALVVAGQETESLAKIGNTVKVPVFSATSSFQSSPGAQQYPFLIQVNQNLGLEFQAIASTISRYKWRSVTVIYEDSDGDNYSLAYLINSLEEENIRISHLIGISTLSSDNIIQDHLREHAVAQQKIFIVHMSLRLSSRVFLICKGLGLMKEGYAWLVSSKTMNQLQLQSLDLEVVEAMQGILGFKDQIPSSNKLRKLSIRWRNEFYTNNSNEDSSSELDIIGIRVYDMVWALAELVEKSLICSGKDLIEEFFGMKFRGLSGQYQILDGRMHYSDHQGIASVNVIGRVGRRVGFWTRNNDVVKRRRMAGDEDIIWPGVTTFAPRGLLATQPKLRILVPINMVFKQFARLHVDHVTNQTYIDGFSIDVFRTVTSYLNYPIEYEFIPLQADGVDSYTAFIYRAYQQEFDGIVGDLTITSNRCSYLDFTTPYTDLGLGTITKRETNDIWLFLRPFRLDLWLVSASFCVLMGFAVWFIERSYSNDEFLGSTAHQIGTIFWFGFSTVFYAQRERLTSNLSRLIVIFWMLVVLILTSTYTATLSSMLTLQKIGFTSEKDYIGIRINNALLRGAIVDNMDLKNDRIRTYYSPEEYADALSKGSQKGGVAAIIDEIPYIKIFLAKHGAHFSMVASQPNSAGFGFAFQKKHAKLVQDLSRGIVRLREEQKLAAMEKQWFKTEPLLLPEDDAPTMANNLELANFGGLFLISFWCWVLVLLIRLGSILRSRLDYLKYIAKLIRDKQILAYMINKIYPRGCQVQQNSPL